MKIKLKYLIEKIAVNEMIKLMCNDEVKYFRSRDFLKACKEQNINRNSIVNWIWSSQYFNEESQSWCVCLVVSIDE